MRKQEVPRKVARSWKDWVMKTFDVVGWVSSRGCKVGFELGFVLGLDWVWTGEAN